ncbi:hypothetical protein D3C85_1576100 [compost metagenome]
MIEPLLPPLQVTSILSNLNPVISVEGATNTFTMKSQPVTTSLTLTTWFPGVTLLNTAGVVVNANPPSNVYL